MIDHFLNKWKRLLLISFTCAILIFTLASHAVAKPNPPNKHFKIEEATIQEIQKILHTGNLTSEELVEFYLQRIEAYDQRGPKINSLLYVNPHALKEAKKLDRERRHKKIRGPLHGIPIILKDNIDTYDMPTTGAAQALEGLIPPDDAFITQKLREAGAIIIAKSNLHELARSGTTVSSLGGQTLNPYDLTRTPGGSSGGTGAAIANNFAVAGLGTDTVNSVRSPSSANSLVGIRPTRGLLSKDGIIPNALSQDTAGPMTRTVADAAILLDVMAGYDPKDPDTAWSIGQIPDSYTDFLKKSGLNKKRIGVLQTLFGSGPEYVEVNQVMDQAIAALKKQGAIIEYVDVPDLDVDKLIEEVDVQVYESKTLINQYLAGLGEEAPVKNVAELLEAGVHPSIEEGLRETQALENGMELPEYKDRLVKRLEVANMIMQTMAEHDLDAFVYPHQKQLVAKVGEPQLDRNGMLAAASGFPAITVPGGFSSSTSSAPLGVPVGVEFLGKPWSEPTLIEIAYAFEQATKHRQPPQLSTN